MIKSRLRVLLAEHEMLQRDLAYVADIRLPTISDMCTNKSKHISVDTLNKMCKVFNCQPGDLFVYIPDEE